MKDMTKIKEILKALEPQPKEFTLAGIKEYPLYLRPDQQKTLLEYIHKINDRYSKIVSSLIDSKQTIVSLRKEISTLKSNQYILIEYLKQIGLSEKEIGDMLSKEVI